MTNATATVSGNNASTATATTVAPATTTSAAPAAPKAPSKKSLAQKIFDEQMALRVEGKFDSNKAFRRTVLDRIVAELEVTMASASTMYNAAKKDAEDADATVALGRDPKKEKPAKVEGAKRGRPVGSKNKTKEGEVVVAGTNAVATTETAVAGEAAPVAEVAVEAAAEVVVVDVKVEAPAESGDAEAVPA